MKPGEPGQGKHPGTSSCWAPTMRQGSGHPTLLLALMGLLGTPAACGEYGHMGCTAGSSETCPAPPSLLGGWGGRWHHPQAKVLPGMQPSTVPLLRGKSRAALLGCSLGLGNGEWDPHPKRFSPAQVTVGPHPVWPTPSRPWPSSPAASRLDPGSPTRASKAPSKSPGGRTRCSACPGPAGPSCLSPVAVNIPFSEAAPLQLSLA